MRLGWGLQGPPSPALSLSCFGKADHRVSTEAAPPPFATTHISVHHIRSIAFSWPFRFLEDDIFIFRALPAFHPALTPPPRAHAPSHCHRFTVGDGFCCPVKTMCYRNGLVKLQRATNPPRESDHHPVRARDPSSTPPPPSVQYNSWGCLRRRAMLA